MGKLSDSLRELPRDCVVVTTEPGIARRCEEVGRRTLLQGRDFGDRNDLRDRWSELSKRASTAQVVGPDWLCEAVERFCWIASVNTLTGSRRSRRWVQHLLANLPLLSYTPTAMGEGGLQGVPAFIVGAGPSLDRNASLIPTAMRRGVVIRVNSATVVPGQVALCIESNDIRHKLHVDTEVRVYGLTCPPEMMRHGTGPLRPVWAGEVSWVPEELTGIARLPTSGSGTTSAVAMAHRWGCNPIVLVGQDCAYTGDRIYAAATGSEDVVTPEGRFQWSDAARAAPRPGNPLPEGDEMEAVPAWGGRGSVRSGTTFNALRGWLTVAADSMGRRVINATEGGSHIPGWEDVPLERVLSKLPYCGLTSDDVAARIQTPLLDRDDLREWMLTTAPGKLAEAWCMADAIAMTEKHRSDKPSRFPWWEARAVRAQRKRMADLLEQSKRELAAYCGALA